MNDLEKELTVFMIGGLNLEDIQLNALTADTPLYGGGFGFDPIGTLEIALLISKKYSFELRSGDPGNQKIFASLGSFTAYVAEYRTQQARTSTRRIPLLAFGRTDAIPTIGALTSHLVLIPSCNPGHKADDTMCSAHAQWNLTWMVADGGTDGSTERLQVMVTQNPGLRVIVLPRNRDRGVAVLADLGAAAAAGLTYVLTMDADGQHPANLVPEFMTASQAAPDAMILNQPMFDATAPQMRVQDRRLSNGRADIETLWTGIDDTLFGSRIHPIAPLAETMRQQS